MHFALLALATLGTANALSQRLVEPRNEPSRTTKSSLDGSAGFSLPIHSISSRDFNDATQTIESFMSHVRRTDLKYGNSVPEDENLSRRQQADLTVQGRDSTYYADISILSSACGTVCQGSPVFDTRASSTFKPSNTKFSISYGVGGVQGQLATDTVGLAGYSASQTFAVIDKPSPDGLHKPGSGLMGLAFKAQANSGVAPLWESLARAKKIPQPVFTFQLARKKDDMSQDLKAGGRFTLGKIDSSQYSGAITYINTVTPEWTIPLEAITINGQDVKLNNKNAVIDTGTELVALPAATVEAIYANVPGSRQQGQDNGSNRYYAVPCKNSAHITFRFGGKNWAMSPADFTYGVVEPAPDGTQMCLGAFFSSGNTVIGAPFLKSVFAVFDGGFASGRARIGFAALNGAPTKRGLAKSPMETKKPPKKQVKKP